MSHCLTLKWNCSFFSQHESHANSQSTKMLSLFFVLLILNQLKLRPNKTKRDKTNELPVQYIQLRICTYLRCRVDEFTLTHPQTRDTSSHYCWSFTACTRQCPVCLHFFVLLFALSASVLMAWIACRVSQCERRITFDTCSEWQIGDRVRSLSPRMGQPLNESTQ